jgi:sec-independent protein translocase protein TatB
MFDIAWSELLLIAVIALIFIGPKELPQVLHSLGRMTAKLRRSADDFRRQFEDSVREAGYEDLHKNIQEFRSLHPGSQLKDSIARAINQEYTPPKPVAPAEDAPPQQTLTDNKAPQTDPQQPKPPTDADASREVAGETAGVGTLEKAALEPVSEGSRSPGASQTLHPAGDTAKDHVAPAA